jgi:hypothetical protein
VPGPGEAPEALDDMRGPARDVERKLFQDLQGALAAAVVDRLGDLEAVGTRVQVAGQFRAEQVADPAQTRNRLPNWP